MGEQLRSKMGNTDAQVNVSTAVYALPVTVRPMRETDVPGVMSIEERSFPAPWPESAYRYELRFGSDSQFYVLQANGQQPLPVTWRDRLRGLWQRERETQETPVLGYVGLRFRGDEAHISTIAVHPDWTGRGMGRFLLLTALERAIQHQSRLVTLEVRLSNRVALRLYSDVGFVQTDLRRGYYRDGEDAVAMALGPLDRPTIARLQGLRQAAEQRIGSPQFEVRSLKSGV